MTAANSNLRDNDCKKCRQEQEGIQATNPSMKPTRCTQCPQKSNFGLSPRSSCLCV